MFKTIITHYKMVVKPSVPFRSTSSSLHSNAHHENSEIYSAPGEMLNSEFK
jgi:hypothetical protein